MKGPLLTVITALLLGVSATWAGPLEDADTAYKRGDYTEAGKQYQVAALQGNARAEKIVGRMYDLGNLGVAKDEAKALKCTN